MIERVTQPRIEELVLPELKLRKAANEGLIFIRTFGGQRSSIQGFKLRPILGREKTNQKIQDINSEGIRNNIKPLNIINPKNIYHSDS